MKRKLDELMRTLPSSSPPLPQEAPSPGNTPPHLDHRNAHPMDMDMDMDPSDNQPIMGQTEGAVLHLFVLAVRWSSLPACVRLWIVWREGSLFQRRAGMLGRNWAGA